MYCSSMYGKMYLYGSLALAEYMEFFEDNLKKLVSNCFHPNKEIEPCGCWDCEDCSDNKRCLPCSVYEQQ